MAKHLGSRQENTKRRGLEFKIPPRLYRWKKPKRRVFYYERELTKAELIPVAAALVLFLAASLAPIGAVLRLICLAAVAFVAGFSPLRRSAVCVFNRRWPNEDVLLLPAALLCFLGGRSAVGAALVILGRAVEFVQAYVLTRSDRSIEAMREILPVRAHLEESFGMVDVLPEELHAGDIILVANGEAVPVDGVVLEGSGPVGTVQIGGPEESIPIAAGSELLSGTINQGETLRLRALRSFDDSALTRQVKSLEESREELTYLEDRIELFSSWYTPAMLVLALFVGLILPAFHGDWASHALRAAVILFLAQPASPVLMLPVIYLGGMCCASHSGLWIRSKAAFSALAHVKTAVFGKTGTVTDGKYTVTGVVPVKGTAEELLRIAALAEAHSRHPIALAICRAAGVGEAASDSLNHIEELPGRGITALAGGRQVYVGNALLMEEHGIWFKVPEREGTAIHVAVDHEYRGHILLADRLRDGAFDAIEELRSQNVSCIAMLTGDVRSATSKLARSLNFDMIKTELSSKDKVSAVRFLRRSLGRWDRLLCVGDGYHDAAMFREADVGLAIGTIGDEGDESGADVLLLDDDLEKIAAAVRIARESELLLWIVVGLAAVPKLCIALLSLFTALPVVPCLLVSAFFDAFTAALSLRSYSIE